MSRTGRRPARDAIAALVALAAVLVAGCATNVVARSDEFVVVLVGWGDTLSGLAERYLGDPGKDWVIAEFNHIDAVWPGQEVVIPLRPADQVGSLRDGFRKVAILTYHRFVPGDRKCDQLAVSAASFRGQLQYLKDNGYAVVSFADLADFVEGRGPMPRKPVILSMDDGYKSVYQVAYPVLREFGYKATVFVYSDFVGAPAALDWAEMKEMVASGLVDIQPHSKSHANLTLRQPGEGDAAYRERIREEVRNPARAITAHLDVPVHTFAFPYGAENDAVLAELKAEGFRLGATVTAGGNPSFAHPLALRRSQIYCDDDLVAFAKRLDVYQPMVAP